MPTPLPPPDWTLADVREHATAWAGPRAFTRAAIGIVVFGSVLTIANLAAGPTGGTADWAPFMRSLVNGAAVGVGLGLVGGHVQAARTRYVRHVLVLPRLLAAVIRPVGSPEGTAVVVLGLLVGFGLPPLAAIAAGVAAVLLAPTGPGVAVTAAIDRALDAVALSAGNPPRAPRATSSAMIFAGAMTAAIALLRVVLGASGDCGLWLLGVPCGTDSAVLLALGAGTLAWVTAPIGAAVAGSLDVALLDTPPALVSDELAALDTLTDEDATTVDVVVPDPVALGTDTVPAEVAPDTVDQLVALVRGRFADLSPGTRTQAVTLIARTLDDDARIDVGQDVMDVLEEAIREAGTERTVQAIGSLRDHAGTISGLRRQYQRTPRLARGTVERAAATAIRATGVPRDVAEPAVRALLTMPDDDWRTVAETLADVSARFAGTTA